MPNPIHFAERAAHYHKLGKAAPIASNAGSLFGLAYLFLEMSSDLRAKELSTGPTQPRVQIRRRLTLAKRQLESRVREATLRLRYRGMS
jgi:hypothetical protein